MLALLLALSALLHAEPRPDWMSGDSASYPKSAYLIGLGEASTQEKAADKARAEIAKAFGVKLSAKTEVAAKEIADKSGSSYSESVSDEVRTSAARVLDGVEVVSYWRDDEGYHHALAVLNRAHNLKVLADKLAELDKTFAGDSESLGKAEGKFARLRLGLSLLKTIKNRRRANENYRILNPEGKGIPPPAAVSEVGAAARKAVSSVTVSVTAAGDESERVAARVVDGLANYGLKAVEAATTPDVLVELQGSGERLPAENLLWFWARGSMKVTLKHGATGEVFKRFTETGQESARDPQYSVSAVMTALADRSADGVYAALTSGNALDD